MCRVLTQSLPHFNLNDVPKSFQRIQGVMPATLLVEDRKQTTDDLLVGYSQRGGFRKEGVSDAHLRRLLAGLDDTHGFYFGRRAV